MKITPAKIEWQEVPKAQDFGDVFFAQGSFTEVNAVFIEPNNLVTRFANATRFSIGETGFASGLSFLSVVKVWLETSSSALYETSTSELHFYSVEKFPWTQDDLTRWYKNHPLEDLAQELIANYPPLIAGWHRVYLFNQRVVLHLYFGEAMEGFASLNHKIDAWFLDGFAPDKNPEMWSVNLFKQLRRLSKISTTLATFTSAGFVRRNLIEAGFAIEKIKGFAGKREMLRGQVERVRNFSSKAPWYDHPYLDAKDKKSLQVGVVGAGLAGAAVALVLAEKGIKVKVFEEQLEPALGASGNEAGLLYPIFTADWSRRSQWYWQGLQTSLRYLKPLVEAEKVAGDFSGCLIIPPTQEQRETLEKCLEFLPQDVIEKVSAKQASELAQVGVVEEAFWIKQAGWVSPKEVVRESLAHPNIEVHFGVKPKIQQLENSWELSNQEEAWQLSHLILATGAWEAVLEEANLEMRRLKGQVTHLVHEAGSELQIAVSHRGYSAPTASGFITGASFEENFNQEDLISAGELCPAEQVENLAMLQEALPDFLQTKVIPLAGRTAVRAMSLDHLPLAGALAHPISLQENYLSQPNNLAPYKYPTQEYLPNLYVSNGHGARGLTSVFLAAEIIAGNLLNHPYLEDENLYQASHTARFSIRAWQKNS